LLPNRRSECSGEVRSVRIAFRSAHEGEEFLADNIFERVFQPEPFANAFRSSALFLETSDYLQSAHISIVVTKAA
jgi:hypothetical protein